jgi:glycosyltransferase involved in cell wall biosynthesis
MKFSIIIPTYRRSSGLQQSVSSLLRQTYTDWEAIIVNDSPDDPSYTSFVSSINDARIHYHVNINNKGVNYSRNQGLDKVSTESKWIIFLDDDDYLAPDALETFHNLIVASHNKWFVTNRAHKNGQPLTQFPKSDALYNYAWNYLILKRCKGDATHCIETKLIRQIRFSEHVKQGEEWLFFYQVGLHSKMYYHDHNSTITEGYTEKGLNFRKRTRTTQLETLSVLAYEGARLKIIYNPSFVVYLLMRFVRALIKP